jgi:hypothetical protein
VAIRLRVYPGRANYVWHCQRSRLSQNLASASLQISFPAHVGATRVSWEIAFSLIGGVQPGHRTGPPLHAHDTPSSVISACRVRHSGRFVMREQAGSGRCTRTVRPRSRTTTAVQADSRRLRAVRMITRISSLSRATGESGRTSESSTDQNILGRPFARRQASRMLLVLSG